MIVWGKKIRKPVKGAQSKNNHTIKIASLQKNHHCIIAVISSSEVPASLQIASDPAKESEISPEAGDNPSETAVATAEE